MASSIFSFSTLSVMLLVLVFPLSLTARSDIVTPPSTPSPFFDNVCDEINCGRGTCSVDVTKPFNFVCNCDPGWRRTPIANEDGRQFLPCVIPNCSINYSCMPSGLPQSPRIPDNITFFDPCYLAYCGEGTCKRNQTSYYNHICNCNPGYTNLLHMSNFPCFSSCAIGVDCNRLEMWSVDVTPQSQSGDSSQGETSGSGTSRGIRFLSGGFQGIGVIVIIAGIRFLSGGFQGIGVIVMSVAVALWK